MGLKLEVKSTDSNTCITQAFVHVHITGIKYGDVKDWQHCWSKYNSTGVPSERKLLLKSLGVASDPWILQR